MAVPDFQTIMLPFLLELRDEKERQVGELNVELANRFQLTDEDLQVLLPSGTQTLFKNRVAWAKTHLKHAGLIESPNRGRVRISDQGLKVLDQKPEYINCRFLKTFPSYLKFIGSNNEESSESKPVPETVIVESKQTPQELMESAFQTLRRATAEDLIDRLKKCSPGFFEIVVVRLLQALGYGATGDSLVTGKSGDGGIDGIIKEDKLGLDIVCVQAKRWEGTVGRPVIQAFVGSMDFVRAKKGVVITTSGFSRDAIDYVERIEGKKVVLIDGTMLAGLMIDYKVGVTIFKQYQLTEASNDFFEDDEG
jgi:restriction system protein